MCYQELSHVQPRAASQWTPYLSALFNAPMSNNSMDQQAFGHHQEHRDQLHGPGAQYPTQAQSAARQSQHIRMVTTQSGPELSEHSITAHQTSLIQEAPVSAPKVVASSSLQTDQSRKRRRDGSPTGNGGSDKRARGRPRIDTKDENAVERRRTQIRLAQRAYRNRKETTLATLENENDHYRNVTSEMAAIVKRIVKDTAALDPMTAARLQSETQRLISLANAAHDNKASGDSSRSHKANASNEDDYRSDEADAAANRADSRLFVAASPPGSKTSTLFPPSSAYSEQYHHRHVSPLSLATSAPAIVTTQATSLPSTPPDRWPRTDGISTETYEVISLPTAENSSMRLPISFNRNSPSFHSIMDESDSSNEGDKSGGVQRSSKRPKVAKNNMPAANKSLATAGMSYPMPIATSSHLWPTLPILTGYAYRETTFGRRLHRTAVELGLQLLAMMNPPPHLYAGVFGFCLLFETREQITDRLTYCFNKGTQYSLDNYRVPFVNLGGIGTHFPAHSAGAGKKSTFSAMGCPDRSMPWGNVGAHQPFHPAHQTGFSMGPFAEKVEKVRDTALDRSLRVSFPGFIGEFFDPEDVELYLRHQGIVIPQGAETVEVEVDANMFANSDGSAGPLCLTHWKGTTPKVGEMYTDAISGALYMPPPPEESQYIPATIMAAPGKKKAVINVDLFAYEIAFRCVCFGRSPGVRPKDVNVAFWRALSVKE